MIRFNLNFHTRSLSGRVRGSLLVTPVLIILFLLLAKSALAASPAWRVAGVTGPTNLPPISSEIQAVTVDAEAGSFKLVLGAEATAPLPFDVGREELAAALDALPALASGGGSVEVSGGPGAPGGTQPYFVRFAGSLAGTNIAQMSAESNLSGGGQTVTVTTKVEGGRPGEGTIAIYATNIGGTSASGALIPIRVEANLPVGITIAAAPTGQGWSCNGAAGESSIICTSQAVVAPGLNLAPISVSVRAGSAALGTRTAQIHISGGGAPGAGEYAEPITVSATPAPSGIQLFQAGAYDEDGEPYTQAGGHPYSASTTILFNTVTSPSGKVVPAGEPRDIDVGLPPGFIGNPQVTSQCARSEPNLTCNEPGNDAIVGSSPLNIQSFAYGGSVGGKGVYNDAAPHGYAAAFSFNAIATQIFIVGHVRSNEDYGVTVGSPNTPQVYFVYGAFVTLWGTPADPGHDAERCGNMLTSSGCTTPSQSHAPDVPFLTSPTDCAEEASAAPLTTLDANTWEVPGLFARGAVSVAPVTGCDGLRFEPTFRLQPESHQAASPSAYSADLEVPQGGLTDPNGLASPDLKKAVVRLPEGVSLNPAAANGLEACSEAQIGFLGAGYPMPNPLRFDESAPQCPEASKLGTVRIRTPLLEEELDGTIYLAAQESNPFHSLLALYLAVDDPKTGVVLKLPGEVSPDEATGRLTATFDDSPQLPFEDLQLHFRGGGPRSELATPEVCGTYKTTGELTPWSAPESGPPAQIEEEGFQITSGAGGGTCPGSEAGRPFGPSFEAGTQSPGAGTYSPLVIKVARKDGEQELTRLEFSLPPGVSGRLAGIPYCDDADVAGAERSTGVAEQRSPSCPAASRLGTVETSAGIGSEPIDVSGMVYLAGPYKGAPLSAVVITPAVAGPFDLGDVVVRAPLYVNPETAQITAKSDPIPTILKGIPLKLRSVDIEINRDGFTLNPTSCQPMAVVSTLSGSSGATTARSSRFQVGGCQALPFKPQLKLSVLGGTNRNAKPKLKAVLTTKPGEANIARAQVNLPHSEFLEQNHIKTVCTRVQFAEGNGNGSACPKGSIYGTAKAWTPLLEKPLEGNVYLRSNGGERKLPDLVAALDGQIDIALWGKVDSGPNKGIRNTFEVVPDAPVSRFLLEMNGGRRGLLVNSENLCSPSAKRTAIVRLTAQSGKVDALKPKVQNQCKKRLKRAAHGKKGHGK